MKYEQIPTDVELEQFSQDGSLGVDFAEDFADEESSGDSSPNGTSTMKMAFMNMANSILGAGIIGQPYAFKNSGLIGGTISMVILAILVDWTLRLMVVNANMSKTRSYQDTVAKCFGRWGRVVLLVAVSSFSYGGCMAACVIIGDTIPHVLVWALPTSWSGESSPVAWMFSRNCIITIFTVAVLYPLSLNRDISRLARASAFALVGMVIIVVLAVSRGPFVEGNLKAPLLFLQKTISGSLFQGISVISFALVCHHNTIFIYNSMRNASVLKFATLTHWACGVAMFFCLVMGVCGLVIFGSNTKGNILNNFKSSDPWINVARFCFGLNMLTTFPLEIFVVRDVLKDLILKPDPNSGSVAHLELSTIQHFLITTVLVFAAMSVALITCNLGMILELIGATSASLMAYIIPPLCYVKLTVDSPDYHQCDHRRFLIRKLLPASICVLFGFAVMIISSIQTISAGSSSDHCSIA